MKDLDIDIQRAGLREIEAHQPEAVRAKAGFEKLENIEVDCSISCGNDFELRSVRMIRIGIDEIELQKVMTCICRIGGQIGFTRNFRNG